MSAVLLDLLASDICTHKRMMSLHTESCALWFSKRKMRLTQVSLSAASPEISKCLRLHSNSIWCARCSDGATINLVAQHCRNLQYFMCENLAVTPHLNAVLGFSKNLQELRLEEVTELHASHFKDVHLPHLKTLSLFCTVCDDALLSTIVYTTDGLQHLNIGKCVNITDVGLIAVAQHCCMLRSIWLSSLQIGDNALTILTELCPHTDHVRISENRLITDAGVLSIARNLNLHSIGLSFCGALTDRALAHLVQFSAATLQKLCAFGFQLVRVDVIVRLLEQCQKLHTLFLDCDIEPYCTDIVPHMHNLQSLLVYGILSDNCLCMIARHCTQLLHLGIPCLYKADRVIPLHSSVLEAFLIDGNAQRMHCTDKKCTEDDARYTEKGVVSMMYGLPNLRLLWAPDVSGDKLSDRVVQCLWQRLRPRMQFVEDDESFYYSVLGEVSMCFTL